MATVSNHWSRAMSDGTFVAEFLGWDGEQLQWNRPPLRGCTRVVDARLRLHPFALQRRSTVALNAFGIRPVERQAGEELGGHATAAAAVVVPATAAGACRLRLAQLAEQRCVLPHVVKTAVRQDISREKAVVDGERAGVDVTHRIDQADHAARAAEVQSRQRTGRTE